MTVIEKVAKNNGITSEEIESEIAFAIKAAMKNPDRNVRSIWKKLSPDGRLPTAEELTEKIAGLILQNYSVV